MIEIVNPKHPDKLADRVAGAIVDLAYTKQENPKVAVEVLLGHGNAHIIIESSVVFMEEEIQPIIDRIVGEGVLLDLQVVPQDPHLADNQKNEIRCGDNGIFTGKNLTGEEMMLQRIAEEIYAKFPSDGKYILDETNGKLIVCQSNATNDELGDLLATTGYGLTLNPLGEWTGGIDVDSGATNRKLGSDMGHSVSGGGLHGKDISKADVSVNIYAWLKAQAEHKDVDLCCAIGDNFIDGRPYSEIVDIAKRYIDRIGGFEKFAEWGLSKVPESEVLLEAILSEMK